MAGQTRHVREQRYCNIGNIIYNISIQVLRVVTSALFFEGRRAGREDNGFLRSLM